MSFGASYQLPLGALGAQLAWMMADGMTELVLSASHLLERDRTDLERAPRAYGLELRRSF